MKNQTTIMNKKESQAQARFLAEVLTTSVACNALTPKKKKVTPTMSNLIQMANKMSEDDFDIENYALANLKFLLKLNNQFSKQAQHKNYEK